MQKPSSGSWEFSLSREQAKWFYIGLWGINAFFLVTNVAMAAGWHPPLNTIARLLDMDKPGSLGKWWLSAQLIVVSLGAVLLAGRGAGGGSRIVRWGWPCLALVTLIMSADSVARMRQDIEGAVRNLLPAGKLMGMELNWTEVFAPAILGFALFLVVFARRVLGDHRHSRNLALWGVALWAASIVLEVIECSILYGKPVAHGIRAFEPAIEQTCQVAGTTLLVMALMELGFAGTARQPGKGSALGSIKGKIAS